VRISEFAWKANGPSACDHKPRAFFMMGHV